MPPTTDIPDTEAVPQSEEEIAGLFTEVLGVGPVGAFDNFFELGGDSLRGAQLVSRCNAVMCSNLEVASLFRRPTVAEFAAELAGTPNGLDAALPPIAPIPRKIYRPDVADTKTAA